MLGPFFRSGPPHAMEGGVTKGGPISFKQSLVGHIQTVAIPRSVSLIEDTLFSLSHGGLPSLLGKK